MTITDRFNLVQRLLKHANVWESVGKYHPAYNDQQLVMDLRLASKELVNPKAPGEER